ncbi:MAG: hypothetical protein GY804_04925 [Alphaproteobacteria bacterium]|nr:hypothetical protein [Alphaproteobacteria bacterium]
MINNKFKDPDQIGKKQSRLGVLMMLTVLCFVSFGAIRGYAGIGGVTLFKDPFGDFIDVYPSDGGYMVEMYSYAGTEVCTKLMLTNWGGRYGGDIGGIILSTNEDDTVVNLEGDGVGYKKFPLSISDAASICSPSFLEDGFAFSLGMHMDLTNTGI